MPAAHMAEPTTGTTAITRARSTAMTLDSWSTRVWGEGVQVACLSALDVLHVRTKNTLYEITILDTASAEVLVRGGRFFPEHRRAILAGSSLGGAFLKLHGVYVNFCMELNAGILRIVTTAVESIAVTSPSGPVQ
jgi:hypothetical protein